MGKYRKILFTPLVTANYPIKPTAELQIDVFSLHILDMKKR